MSAVVVWHVTFGGGGFEPDCYVCAPEGAALADIERAGRAFMRERLSPDRDYTAPLQGISVFVSEATVL